MMKPPSADLVFFTGALRGFGTRDQQPPPDLRPLLAARVRVGEAVPLGGRRSIDAARDAAATPGPLPAGGAADGSR